MENIHNALTLREDCARCFLCDPAPCTAACPYGLDPAKAIRSARFENVAGAAMHLPVELPCDSCKAKPCLPECLKTKTGRGIPIDNVMKNIAGYRVERSNASLEIDFCGIRCENPFFLSSSIVANDYDMIARAFDMGWAGAATKTIGTFVPKEVSPRFDAIRKEATPFLGFKNIEQISERTVAQNLGMIHRLKTAYPAKVMIASIMGRDEAEWTALSKMVTEAGADVIECNFSCPHMAADGLGSDVGQNPELVAAFTRAALRGTTRPVLAKMTPNLGQMEPPAIAAVNAGAAGIAAINTIKSVMNVNLFTFASGPDVGGQTSIGGYSGKAVKPIALRFIQAMKQHPQLAQVPISGMGGVETWRDAMEFLALGCETVQVTTSIMQYGYRIIEDMLEGSRQYLSAMGLGSIRQVIGHALPHIVSAEELDRDTISYPRINVEKCVGCGRCRVSCDDAGHQAIGWGVDHRPQLNQRCVGCHLCLTVCPTDAITPAKRVPKRPDVS